MIKHSKTKKQNKKFDGDYTYKTNDNLYIIRYFEGVWCLELRTHKLSDTYIKSFKLLKDVKLYLNN